MIKKIILSASLILTASFANSASITQNIVQDFPFVDDRTNFTKDFTYEKFDDMGGARILESVTFEMSGRANGTGGAENLRANQTGDYTAILNVALKIIDQGGLFASVNLSEQDYGTLAGYDGTFDFLGASSVNFLNLTASDFVSFTVSAPSLLPDYIGMGNRTATFDSVATSTFTGSGNMASTFGTEAGADIRIVYKYSEVITEVATPSSIALLTLGVLALGIARRKNKAANKLN